MAARAHRLLFITHNIDEALVLCERVVVMTARRGTVKEIVAVDLPRPRDENQPEFLAYRRRISEQLQDEIDKSLVEREAAKVLDSAATPSPHHP